MPREYYAYAFRYSCRDGYFLWYSNDCDGVHLESDGCVPTFDSIEDLKTYAKIHGLNPLSMDVSVLLDLDSVDAFTRDPSPIHVDCKTTLDAWNLFGDFARSIGPTGGAFVDQDQAADRLYDKIFHGSNLPSITPEGQEFTPTWKSDEIQALQEILSVGFSIFRPAVKLPSQGIEEAEQGVTPQSATRSEFDFPA